MHNSMLSYNPPTIYMQVSIYLLCGVLVVIAEFKQIQLYLKVCEGVQDTV